MMYKIRLSPYHKIFYNEWQLDPLSSKYNIVFDQTISKELNLNQLANAFHRVIADHLILNSHIIESDETLYWVANNLIKDLEIFSKPHTKKQIYEYISQSFKLDCEPLYRFAVFFTPDGNYRLILVLHNIILDDNAFTKFIQTISDYYNDDSYRLITSFKKQEELLLLRSNQYQQRIDSSEVMQQKFWRNALSDLEVIDFKFMQAAVKSEVATQDVVKQTMIKFPSNVIPKLQQLDMQYGIDSYVYGSIIMAILLYHYTSQPRFGISYLIDISDGPDLLYGAQANNNIYPCNFESVNTVIDLIKLYKDFIVQVRGKEYRYYPINDIVEHSGITVPTIFFAKANLRDVSFNFKDAQVLKINQDIMVDVLADLVFKQDIGVDKLSYVLMYKQTWVDKLILHQSVNYYKKVYLAILSDLCDNQIKPISHYLLLSKEEYTQLVYTWNETKQEYPRDKTIHELFEEQVEKTPDNIAVVYEATKLTYTILNQKANQLANYLKDKYQIKGDDLIALCLDRDERMLIAILAVLKSGGAYVPLDPNYPEERISYILEDTKARVLITSEVIPDLILHLSDNQSLNVIRIDNPELQPILEKQSILNPAAMITSHNLAYVIYTSGTTGRPKGVMIEHSGVINLISIESKKFDLFSNKRNCFLYASYVFDAHVFELYAPIINGQTIHIINSEVRQDLDLLSKYIEDNNVVLATIPPALLTTDVILKLELLIVAGEVPDKKVLNAYVKHNIKVINAYGPTEATVCVSMNDYIDDVNNIGKPLSNTSCYILDSKLNPLPIGAVGELYIGGDGLARGYLNLPELTNERFIANPFQSEVDKARKQNSRLYKTGDLVRYLPDGHIEYIGRNDFQVKIRGFRIELGEIETQLSEYPGVKQAVVLAKEDVNGRGNKYLVAYYVAAAELDEDEILEYLYQKLPKYMVPSILVYLEKFTLTINGKLDKNSLPNPKFRLKDGHMAPKNELEQQVCEIYAEVLAIDADKISMNDDFFRLGGNSILAIKLVSKLNKHVLQKTRINVATVFKHKTIDSLLDSILSADDNLVVEIPKLSKKESKLAALSFAQERLWFIENYNGGSNAYNIPIRYKLSESIDLNILVQSIQNTISRHEILHTMIKTDNNGLSYQMVCDLSSIPFVINRIDINQSKQYQQIIHNEVNHIFKLDEEYPIRISLLLSRISGEKYILIVVHHIAFDGWSMDILLRDIQAYYTYYQHLAMNKHTTLALANLSIQYKDFAVWQREYLSGERLAHQLNYWSNKLSGYVNLNLVTDYPRPKRVSYIGDDVFFRLERQNTARLKQLAKDLGVSLYSVLLAGFNLLLRVYSNQDDIVIGSPIANRHHNQLEDLVGFFVNSLALRSIINPEQTLEDYIKHTGDEIVEAQLHQDLPFEKLVEELHVVKDESRHPIFQVMFGVQSFGRCRAVDSLFIETDYRELGYKIAKFDLSLMIDDSGDELDGIFNYATALYTKSTIEGFIETYLQILDQLSDKRLAPIKELSYLSKSSYRQIVYTWNKTSPDYQSNKTIHQLFEEQVEKRPNNIAIVYEDKQLTYQQLNKQANQLAHYLKDTYNIQGDDLIALCLDRSEYMLIAILGVLKAGGAYVPLDPNYPKERINYILEDTKARVLITSEVISNMIRNLFANDSNKEDEHHGAQTNKESRNLSTRHFVEHRHVGSRNPSSCHSCVGRNPCPNVIIIDNPELQPILEKQPISNPIPNINSNNLAYVIYTSGTTGKPKGVLQLHGNVSRLFSATNNWYKFNNKDVWTLFHSYVFDFSVWEIWGALIYGGKLVIPTQETTRDTELFYELCKREKVTVLNQTPNAFYQFIDTSINQAEKLSSLRYVIFGGDALNLVQLKPWFEYYGDRQPELINMYGITETTVHVTYKKLSRDDVGEKSYIGRLIPDMKAYILDNNLEALPVGAIGELYVGGAGLARGYLNLPELTATRFIINPFQTEREREENTNNRLYKTGDLVRYMADGNIEYIGRNDFQVKIRGFRIELGEIEAKLSGFNGVKQAVVLAKEHIQAAEDGSANKYLLAYYVADNKLDENAIIKHLNQELPEYMVPSILIYLDKLPLTINGKLDKQALPDPDFKGSDTYIAPRNEIEQQICTTYAEVLYLDVKLIGINSDFFKLGGNSILVIRLVSNLRQKYNFQISVNEMFSLKTPQAIATRVKYSKNNLDKQLEVVKLLNQKLKHPKVNDLENMQIQRTKYLESIKKIKFAQDVKPISNILLTGATGYFGCNILYQILITTNYTVYVLVRAPSHEIAYERIQHKFRYYFAMDIEMFGDRVIIIAGDIEKINLNLDLTSYKNLIKNIDSIIHCAALVKHYGDYEEFYKANVLATINLLKLCMKTNLKDFHYISTVSVLMDGYIPNISYYEFNEDMPEGVLANRQNVYARTKYQGEQEVIQYRQLGINSNIYRLGNMSMNSKTYKNQENIEDNAFINIFKTMLTLGVMPDEFAKVEISPVDCAASSVVVLFDKIALNNQTYHIFNPHIPNLLSLISQRPEIKLSRITFNKFIEKIKSQLETGDNIDQIQLFMLHQGWLQEHDLEHLTTIHVLQDKTEFILAKLGFKWPHITIDMLSDLLNLQP